MQLLHSTLQLSREESGSTVFLASATAAPRPSRTTQEAELKSQEHVGWQAPSAHMLLTSQLLKVEKLELSAEVKKFSCESVSQWKSWSREQMLLSLRPNRPHATVAFNSSTLKRGVSFHWVRHSTCLLLLLQLPGPREQRKRQN